MARHVEPTVSGPNARTRETEEPVTDKRRFSLLVSVMGVNDAVREQDERSPEGVPMSPGYVPVVPRLGVPSLLSDASLGVGLGRSATDINSTAQVLLSGRHFGQ